MYDIAQCEITCSTFFLVDNEGYLRKPNKSQLGIELLKLCPEIDSKGPETLPHTNVCITDFYGFGENSLIEETTATCQVIW